MFDKILIANRGEIACRVARTCRQLGIRTVAVYSEADRHARHVAACDEAYCIGPAAARDSYLRSDALLTAAQASGAQAIHPGYGFLAENVAFAEAVADAGLIFIGPPVAAIRAMGSKSAAKAIMAKAGVPLVPGYHGEKQSLAHLAAEAETIGYPLLIKASLGGGGKGMRVVERPDAFADALASAQREAKAAFGDDHVLVEKYLSRPRHIEIQVFADGHGNVVHLHERDCSIQRRHQKVLEEAPAPGLSPNQRAAMGEAAVAAAQAIGYQGAGTVEFIAEGENFFFMEMNTRLQVEHPVTEAITGQDLVEWQLRVAAGEPLPLEQEVIPLNGHAVEVRLYAEDPSRDFLPATGTLQRLRTPTENPHVRIDTGVSEGDSIGVHYDPMIAKLIVWDQDRPTALRRLARALADYQIVGLTTNREFLVTLVQHPAFVAGDVHTGFIPEHHSALFPDPEPASDRLLALAVLHELLRVEQQSQQQAQRSADPFSPWQLTTGWRLNDDVHQTLHFRDGEREVAVTVHYAADHYRLELPSGVPHVRGHWADNGDILADLDGLQLRASVVADGEQRTVFDQGISRRLTVFNPLTAGMDAEAPMGSLAAPMPGTVISVLVADGDVVSKGQALLILEAMKMEHTITAPRDGRVEQIALQAGQQVAEGVELLVLGDEAAAVAPKPEVLP